MPGQHSVEEASASNAALEEALSSNGVVDRELYLRLSDAHIYHAASTAGWVEAQAAEVAAALAAMRDTLLPRPSSGQLRVSGVVRIAEQTA